MMFRKRGYRNLNPHKVRYTCNFCGMEVREFLYGSWVPVRCKDCMDLAEAGKEIKAMEEKGMTLVETGKTVPMVQTDDDTWISPKETLLQRERIKQVMVEVLRENVHYGIIPGTDKPTLYQAGAQILQFVFRLVPKKKAEHIELPHGHREVRTDIEIWSLKTNRQIGLGVGTCTTMETKYRYRNADPIITDKPLPRGFWKLKKQNFAAAIEMIGGKEFTFKKQDGQWWIAKKTGEKVEYENPADYYNTVEKMSFKRGYVMGIINALAAGDILAPPLEEEEADEERHAGGKEGKEASGKDGKETGDKKDANQAGGTASKPGSEQGEKSREAYPPHDSEIPPPGDPPPGPSTTINPQGAQTPTTGIKGGEGDKPSQEAGTLPLQPKEKIDTRPPLVRIKEIADSTDKALKEIYDLARHRAGIAQPLSDGGAVKIFRAMSEIRKEREQEKAEKK